MPNTMESVLQTTELLTQILTLLPPKDLLINAQRVNQYWKNTIQTSSALQQILFFAPIPTDPTNPNNQSPMLNPLLQKPFEAWFKLVNKKKITKSLDYSNDFSISLGGPPRCAMYEKASWRKMLPVQPAPTVLEIIKMNPTGLLKKPGMPPGEVCEMVFEGGVRMGLLYDLAWETACKPLSGFALLWRMFQEKSTVVINREVGNDIMAGVDGIDPAQASNEIKDEGHFKVGDNVTLVMDLSMPVPGAYNSMKPEHKSLAYESVEIDFAPVNMAKLIHLMQMCRSGCKEH